MNAKYIAPLLGVLSVLCLVAMAGFAKAQSPETNCGPREQLIGNLDKKYHEKRVAQGLISDELMMEIYASDVGTWTYIVVGASGRACIAGFGDNFEHDTSAFKPGQGS